MKVLVTGANGYLGQGIVKRLVDDSCEVIATDFKLDNVDDRAIKKQCNLFEIDDPYTYFEQPDVLLHLAWRDGFLHYSDAHFIDLPQHYLFIKKMTSSEIKKIAVMGSMHEVGFYEGSINEDTACKPESFYGIAKNSLRECSELLSEQNNKVFQWIRGFYIVGNSKFGSSIFSKITAAEERGDEEFPFTKGLNQFDFVDYEEFCRQVALIVEQDKINGIINVGSGYPERISDRVERFIKDNGYKIKLKYGAFPDRPYDSKAVWGDNKKINAIINDAMIRSSK